MKKIIPYLYIVFGLIILVDTATQLLADKSTYVIIASWKTDDKLTFGAVKALISFVFMAVGYNRLKALRW
ncbi:hypothetical protein [Tenacibaculum geojense]|uniref:Uncharacterized protein n=1 Tax=Tenacibaculum geojense TaxID=915352 RepID=A0ABW3JS26_9FLAO